MATYQFKSFRAMHIQLVLAHWNEPWVSQHLLAQRFGLTDAWCSQILTSPEAQDLIAKLKNNAVDTVAEVELPALTEAEVGATDREKSGAEFTVQVNEALPDAPVASDAVTVTFDVPAVVGVPEIRPVEELTDRPAGRPVAPYVNA